MGKTKILLSFLGIVLISLISIVSADAGDGFSCFSGGMMSGAYGYGGMAFGWIFGLLIVVALVLLIIWLTKQIQKKNNKR